MSNSDELNNIRGNKFFKKSFTNNILSTNIAIYQYLANLLFDGDMDRIVWSIPAAIFRRRQTQLVTRKKYKTGELDLGLMDFPFCAFHLTQDGVQPKTNRNWWNASLNVKGIWIPELEERLRITPITLNYEAIFCCSHDSDLYMIQQSSIWGNTIETIAESSVDITNKAGVKHTLKNIIIIDITPKMNTMFDQADWLQKNRIQTISFDISCQTWLMSNITLHKYSITKKVLFNFLHGVKHQHLIKGEGTVDELEKIAWKIFV